MTLRSTAFLLLGLVAAGCASNPPIDVPVYEGKPLGHWLEEMKDLSRDRRQAAAMAVITFGEEAAPFLASMLREDRVHMRRGAAYALARMGRAATSASSVLLAALEDPDGSVREDAWAALWHLAVAGMTVPGVPEAMGRVVEAETNPRIRTALEKDLDAYRMLLDGGRKEPGYIER